jgi:hypothetical protein
MFEFYFLFSVRERYLLVNDRGDAIINQLDRKEAEFIKAMFSLGSLLP